MELDYGYSPSDFAWLQDRWTTLKNGHTGVQFEALLRFSQPLWKFYDLHSNDVLGNVEQDIEFLDTAASVLESARLIWAYCNLDKSQQRQAFSDLATRMLGEQPDAEESEDFDLLLSTMQTHFKSMPHDEMVRAEFVEGYDTLSFDELLDVFSDENLSPTTEEIVLDERYGPHHLVAPDALAVFAEPLLDQALANMDSDLEDSFEMTMNKASDYWELARSTGADFELMLAALKRRYANAQQTPADVETEAHKMVERFFILFPEKKTSL